MMKYITLSKKPTKQETIALLQTKIKKLETMIIYESKTCEECIYFPVDWKTQLPKRKKFCCGHTDFNWPWKTKLVTAKTKGCYQFDDNKENK